MVAGDHIAFVIGGRRVGDQFPGNRDPAVDDVHRRVRAVQGAAVGDGRAAPADADLVGFEVIQGAGAGHHVVDQRLAQRPGVNGALGSVLGGVVRRVDGAQAKAIHLALPVGLAGDQPGAFRRVQIRLGAVRREALNRGGQGSRRVDGVQIDGPGDIGIGLQQQLDPGYIDHLARAGGADEVARVDLTAVEHPVAIVVDTAVDAGAAGGTVRIPSGQHGLRDHTAQAPGPRGAVAAILAVAGTQQGADSGGQHHLIQYFTFHDYPLEEHL